MKDIDYAAPKTVAEACALLQDRGDKARCLAGGTDIIVQVREHRRDVDVLVDIKRIPELNALSYDAKEGLRIGAAVPCYRIYENQEIANAYPGLIDAVSLVSVRLPPPKPRSGAAYLRFIPRNEMDIAVAGAGVAVTLDEKKAQCVAARVSLAAVAPTPLLVETAGAALVGTDIGDSAAAKA